MEINANMSSGSVNRPTSTTRPKSTDTAAAPTDSFAHSVALENALAAVPDVRSDAVSRARQLIGDSNYPSADTVRQIAGFLAKKISSPGE